VSKIWGIVAATYIAAMVALSSDTMSSKSVYHVARSCLDLGSFDSRLLRVVNMTCGDFHDFASNFVPISGKVLRRHSELFNKPSGTKS
jgi:hypothetical protein